MESTEESPPVRIERVVPVFAVRDLASSLRHYRTALGFSVAWTWGEPAERAGVTLDALEIQLVQDPPGGPAGPSSVYCHVTDVARYFAACRARGATLARELGTRPWGVRDFQVVDPDGNRLGFAEPSG